MRIVAIDFETANEQRSSPCAVGVAWIEGDRVVRSEERLIRPREMRFSPMNMAIHGIRPQDVAGEPEFPDVWKILRPHLEGALVLAHNASFDMSVLRCTLEKYSLDFPRCSYLCTLVVARKVWPDLPRHKLDSLTSHLGLSLRHHQACDDAVACGRIALAAAARIGVASIAAIPEAAGIGQGSLFPGGYCPCSAGRS